MTVTSMGDFALDASSYLHANVLPLPFAVVVATAVLTLSVYWTLYSGDNENAVAYDIALPDEPQASLPHPSLKIPNSTAIQCYTPATGKLLGRVNPHHPEGIDRAVSKASEAQKIWAKTSFAERRRVLKTLLKSVGFNFPDESPALIMAGSSLITKMKLCGLPV